MSTIVEVRRCCDRCESVGRLAVGMWQVIELRPKSAMAGFIVLAAMCTGMASGYAASRLLGMFSWLPKQISGVADVLFTIGACAVVLDIVPWRVLVCEKCQRVVRSGFGRKVPLEWQECIKPTGHCVTCGYSLVGLTVAARCPECGCAFPEEWLKSTVQPLGPTGGR